MSERKLKERSKIEKNAAITGIIILIIGIILYLLFPYLIYDLFILWSLLSFSYAFMIGYRIKYWIYKKIRIRTKISNI